MPLNWNATKVQNFDKLDAQELEAVIWALYAVGVPTLTKATIHEAAMRIQLLEAVRGPLFERWSTEDDATYPTRIRTQRSLTHAVYAYVGLSTNVSKVSRAAFLKSLAEEGVRTLQANLEAEEEGSRLAASAAAAEYGTDDRDRDPNRWEV
jgi:hypothetical protein